MAARRLPPSGGVKTPQSKAVVDRAEAIAKATLHGAEADGLQVALVRLLAYIAALLEHAA